MLHALVLFYWGVGLGEPSPAGWRFAAFFGAPFCEETFGRAVKDGIGVALGLWRELDELRYIARRKKGNDKNSIPT